MRLFLAIIVLTAVSVQAQTVANTHNVLHPIMKDPNNRQGMSSLDRDPAMKAEYMPAAINAQRASAAHQSAYGAAEVGVPVKPTEIVTRIDPTLVVSKISVIGTLSGLKGRLYVTNTGPQLVIPHAQFAVCDRNGVKIGSATKAGDALAPNEGEQIEVLATNVSAVDLKLMTMSTGSGK